MSSDSTPRTAAGRRLLDRLEGRGDSEEYWPASAAILAIEAEAASPTASGDALREARYSADQAHALLRDGYLNRSWHKVGLARQYVKTLRAALAAEASDD